MKEMVIKVPLGACPKCAHKQFVVSELSMNEYLTNADGEIVDDIEIEYSAAGMCCNCGTVFKMYPTREGFIPLTRLREIMFNYSPHVEFIKLDISENIPNPMEVINAR
jgi:hypothetical protein